MVDVTETGHGDFGATLRAARERQGISLRQIAASTKISVVALEALEANDVSCLPGGIFTRSFVRLFASAVGLDPENTVREFMAEFPSGGFDEGIALAGDQEEEYRQYASQQMIARTVAGLIAVSIPVAALLVFFPMSAVTPAPEFTGATQAAARLSGGAGEPVGVAEPLSDSSDGSEVPKARPDARARLDEVAPITESIPVAEAASPDPPAAVTEATPADVAIPVAEADAEAALQPLTIDIHPRAPCWVSLTLDGQRVFSRVLLPGEREVHEAQRDIVIKIGDAAAFSFSINQQQGQSLGAPGEVVHVRIDRDNYRDFLLQHAQRGP